jgi:hypothetical protein
VYQDLQGCIAEKEKEVRKGEGREGREGTAARGRQVALGDVGSTGEGATHD